MEQIRSLIDAILLIEPINKLYDHYGYSLLGLGVIVVFLKHKQIKSFFSTIFCGLTRQLLKTLLSDIVDETEVMCVETNAELETVCVVTNSLRYELDDRLGYDKIIASNCNRRVTYFYILPNTSEIRNEWETLKQRVAQKQGNLDFLKAFFCEPHIAALAIHGLAIYKGKRPLHGDVHEYAIQYLPQYQKSVRVDMQRGGEPPAKATFDVINFCRANASSFL